MDVTGYQDDLSFIKGSNSMHEEGHPQSSQRDCPHLMSMLTQRLFKGKQVIPHEALQAKFPLGDTAWTGSPDQD